MLEEKIPGDIDEGQVLPNNSVQADIDKRVVDYLGGGRIRRLRV